MDTQNRLIEAKISILQMAHQLGNISKACKKARIAREELLRDQESLRAVWKKRPGAEAEEKTSNAQCVPGGRGEQGSGENAGIPELFLHANRSSTSVGGCCRKRSMCITSFKSRAASYQTPKYIYRARIDLDSTETPAIDHIRSFGL